MKKMIFSLLLLQTFSAAKAFAANPSVDFEIDAGAQQDSNLTVSEIDKKSNQSDLATLLNAKADAKWKAADEKLSISGSYAYSSKTYQQYDDFDLAIHQLSADANYNFTAFTAGANYFYADANLGGNDFLNLSQTSLYISKLFNDRIYLRGASNFQNKEFSKLSSRNADNKGVSGDAFIFFNQGKTFVSVGIATENENAKAHEFDYKGKSIKARVSNKFLLWRKENKLQTGIRLVDRDYSGITAEINKKRSDKSYVADIEWEVGLSKNISIATKVERGNYNSNLPSADYSDTNTSLLLKIRF